MVLIIALLQSNVVDAIAVTKLHVVPDLMLILMVFFAIRCNIEEAIICSFAIGLAADLITTGFRMGPMIISFGLFGTGLAYLNRIVAIRKIAHQAMAILIIGVAAGVLIRILSRSVWSGWFGTIVGTAIYSAVVGPFLFIVLDLIMNIKSKRRRD
jgi:cell shape-determining protein MreD